MSGTAELLVTRVLTAAVDRGDAHLDAVEPLTDAVCALLRGYGLLPQPEDEPAGCEHGRPEVDAEALGLYLFHKKVRPLRRFLSHKVPLGKRVRAQRMAMGWSRLELAALTDSTASWVRSVELGYRTPPFDRLVALFEVLGIPLAPGHLDATGKHRYFTAGFRAGQAGSDAEEDLIAIEIDGA